MPRHRRVEILARHHVEHFQAALGEVEEAAVGAVDAAGEVAGRANLS